jgi:hypothetical protein
LSSKINSTMSNLLRKAAMASFAAVALSTFATSARADLVINGGFETTTNGGGQMNVITNATGWATTGYNFIFTPGSADTTGVSSQFGTDDLLLWGPNDGSANGLPATSPAGGNFVGADGAYDAGAITQTINGLTAGNSYTVGFWWAGAQQHGFDGVTTEQWQVSFGSQTQSTAVVTNADKGFTGWEYQTLKFTADSTSDVLSFLAVGTPLSPSEPPFVLLDGVSVDAASTPEPGSILLGLSVFLGVGALGFFRSKKQLKS